MRTPANGLLILPGSRGLPFGPRDGLHLVELLPPLGDRLRRELREVEVVALPGRVRAPPERRPHGGARARRALEDPQRELERLPLRLDVERPAGRVAERKIAEQEARNTTMLDDV